MLHAAGHELVLVSSGAIAAGFGSLGFKKRPTQIADKQDKQIAEYIQGQWKKIGVNVEIKALEEKNFWEETDDLKYNVMLNYSWGAPWDLHVYINAMVTVAENGNPDYEAQLGLPMKKELDAKIHLRLFYFFACVRK